jgi:murein DD-endopeptidase MepM/ murein hydrolase activator NlpD
MPPVLRRLARLLRWRLPAALPLADARALLGVLLGMLLWLPLYAQADGVYTVAPGDTLSVIANRFGISLDLLVQVNGISDPNRITVGQQLIIPTADGQLPLAAIPTAVRRAEPGDSLRAFAARYAQEPQLIADLNGLDAAARIFPGQPLRVPEDGLAATPLRFGAVTAVTAPDTIVQGRTGRVVVATDHPVELRGVWLDQELVFTPLDGDGLRQFALLPAPALQEIGSYNLVIGYTTARGQPVDAAWPVAVVAGDYASQQIVIDDATASAMTPEAVQSERERVVELWSQVSQDLLWSGPFARPIDPLYATTSSFGTRRTYSVSDIGNFHAGQDYGAPEGASVTAPAAGVVVLAEPLVVRGNAVILDHGRGIFTGYWHLSELQVEPGQVVTPGDVLGLVGNTGLSTGAHLHWELRINGVAVDPLQFIEESPAGE